MSASSRASNATFSKRIISLVATIALAISGAVSISSPANAGTNVDVYYFGNTIGTVVPASTTVDRDLVPVPAAASVTGSRTGYMFGGWSPTVGGAAITDSTYRFSSTALRLDLHSVWNTTLTYNLNGADSGALSTGRTSDAYRFGQALTLPTVGTLVKSGFAFGGWMASSVSTTRITTYTAGSTEVGNPTLYAAWIKTVSFNPNGATIGATPASLVYVNGGARLMLPVASQMTLRKPGYEFVGWSSTSSGSLVSNPSSYVPVVSQRTLFAIWKIQTTKAATQVFFNPDKSSLRAAQKIVILEMVRSLAGRTAIKISVAATRARGDLKSLGKARNSAVVDYIRSLGVDATFTRTSSIGTGYAPAAKKNNRVTLSASWTN